MAIALRAVGTRLKADVTVTGSPLSCALPAGHVANDLILMFVLTDANTNVVTDPSGWTRLYYITNGTSASTPYTARCRLKVYYRIDNGSLGSSVSLDFDTTAWPTGDPSVLAFTVAYSGCDPTGPIDQSNWITTVSTVAAQAHPQLTTVVPNDWLVTYRAASTDTPPATYTNSVGTDSERVDDVDAINELSCALYDSNAALTAGLQTQRTTTASRAATYGSLMVSIAIKPAPAANAAFATPGAAEGTGTAYGPTTTTVVGPWDFCGLTGVPEYTLAVDWNGDGIYSPASGLLSLGLMGSGSLGDEITGDTTGEITFSYGRDQNRQLSPASVGSAALTVCNVSRRYTPENVSSPLYGDLDPARDARFQVTYASTVFPLFQGKIDDYDLRADFSDRNVSFTFLDGMALLQGANLSTGVYASLRTGAIVNTVLDLIGWTAGRDIDLGATIVKYWWAEGVDAFTAVQDLVKSEGPPSVAYVAPDGTFVFRDRHHRLQRSESTDVQGSFGAAAVGCAAPAVSGLGIAQPFTYTHGWRDIINRVDFDVSERAVAAAVQDVWTSEDVITLSIGEGRDIETSGSDPFVDAVIPVQGTDFTKTGPGTVNVTLSRTSGQSVRITVLAVGGSVIINGLRLRARPIPVQSTVKVSKQSAGSVTQHGERAYPDQAPWANANDASAIADAILLHYAERRPTVQLRIVAHDPSHYLQILRRTISDRLHIRHDETGLDHDFFVERVTHTIQRFNQDGKPPVHSVILGCERVLELSSNPFRFDVRGAGFNDGVFDPIQADDEDTVFTFDHPVQGQFDTGLFGT